MSSQQEVINSLPTHLQPFAATQDYSRYSPRDHAVWRFLLHQLSGTLDVTAHSIYLEGLARTGINLELIPRIEEMNACMASLGWRAVVVDGFVPPSIFMEFQAHKVLVVAVDMRTIEHMLYTPSPDIVHESSGHAPFIIDVDYAEFLQRFGELGMRAVASKGDMDVYEAIRHLSIVKEAVGSSAEEIEAVEKALQKAKDNNKVPSEAALLARLHWWTVEYGLVGDTENYKVFGAGLLSSLGESVNCLDDNIVKKIPLTINAIASGYDITTEQPQLFVTKSCRHLTQILEEFGRQMCVSQGGSASVKKVIDAQTVNTVVMSSGVEISGQFSRLVTDFVDSPIYVNTVGPTQLAYKGKELTGHSVEYHDCGFGSPVGRLQGMERCVSSYTIDELKQYGIGVGELVVLEFLSGVIVRGFLTEIVRRDQKNIILRFEKCKVVSLDGELLFHQDWGVYDMAVGDAVVSVFGGSADRQAYPLYRAPSVQSQEEVGHSDRDRASFDLYRKVRDLRERRSVEKSVVLSLLTEIQAQACDEWLLVFEAIELAKMVGAVQNVVLELTESLKVLALAEDEQRSCLINYGLERLGLGSAEGGLIGR